MTEQRKQAIVIGGGLAGCEAAWQLAQNGIAVTLYEQKPEWSGGTGLLQLVESRPSGIRSRIVESRNGTHGVTVDSLCTENFRSSWRSTGSGSGCIFRFGNGTNPLPSADYAGNCNH